MNTLIEALGWYGTIAIVTAFALTSFGVIHPSDSLYLALNITGAVGIIVVSYRKKAYQPAVLNVVWLLIAVISIFKSS